MTYFRLTAAHPTPTQEAAARIASNLARSYAPLSDATFSPQIAELIRRIQPDPDDRPNP